MYFLSLLLFLVLLYTVYIYILYIYISSFGDKLRTCCFVGCCYEPTSHMSSKLPNPGLVIAMVPRVCRDCTNQIKERQTDQIMFVICF